MVPRVVALSVTRDRHKGVTMRINAAQMTRLRRQFSLLPTMPG